MTKYSTDWIGTYSKPRGFVRPLELEQDDILISDIQHALSNICRYNGHCREFYSVAQHAVHVSEWLSRNGHDLMTQFMGLHHDDSEAYMGDITRPMKKHRCMQEFMEIDLDIQRKIMAKFGIEANPRRAFTHWWVDAKREEAVTLADNELLSSEMIQLFQANPKDWHLSMPIDYFLIKPISPRDAKLLYEDRHHELMVALQEL